MMIAGAILLFVAVAIVVFLGLRGTGRQSAETPTPTERAESTATAFASPILEPTCETIISSGDVEVSAALPVSLTIGGAVYAVEPIVPQREAWVYPPDRSGKVVWVCGTIVNYVLGLEPTAGNEELLRALAPGDEITLRLSSGTALRFRFAERQDAVAGAESAMSQQEPRLTLVLPKGDNWQIATAEYAAETEAMEVSPAGTSARPGQSFQIGQTSVTLNRSYAQDSENVPQGTMYYLTEFTVRNNGESPLAGNKMSARLTDGMGNTYLPSPQASQAGESGPITGEIQPGASVRGSIGFVVPDPLPSGELSWLFSLRPGSEEARVTIPREAGTGEAVVSVQPEVMINDAFLSDEGTTLIIEGEVRNRDTQPLSIATGDVTLSSSAGPSELVMAAPRLPWTIQPEDTQVIELQYERPDASSVLLELLGYSFEIAGLQ